MRTRAQAADPTALDVPYLATTYEVPEAEVQTLVDAPTADLVLSFLASICAKAHDLDALKTDKVKVDVALENVVRTSEAKVKAQKAQVTKHVKEAEELRTKLNQAESARESLSSELEQLRTSSSGSTAETTALRQRIETLEASNRDALALVESKSTEKDRLATELSEHRNKFLSLRREISQLEEKNQSLSNAASSQKFKEQSLQQEIDLLKKNNEWHANELQTRTQEHAKFRKERNARIASLQRELDDSNATVDTLKRTESTLRQRLEEVQGKADEAFTNVATLQEEAARKEQDFRTELDATKRLADLQAQNAATHKARLQDVQGQIEQIKEDAADEIGRLQAEVETERADKEQAEQRVAELELQVERLEQQPRASRPGTPMRNGGLDPTTPARFGASQRAESSLPGSLRKTVGGLSFTQLYSNYTELQTELETERRRTAKLTAAMDELVTEMEGRAPEFQDLKDDQDRLEREVLTFSTMLDDANQTRDAAIKEVERWQTETSAAVREGDILRQQLRDLSAQIKILLVELQSRDQGLEDMSTAERMELERAARGELADGDLERLTDTGRFIAERLTIFHDVNDLQTKNQDLLRIVQTLGDKLEGEEAQEKERQSEAFRNENEELRLKCQRLQDELQATVTQVESYVKERDMFRRMLQHRGQLPPGLGEEGLQSMFGQSQPPMTPARGSNGDAVAQTPRSKDVEDLNKLLREQQSFFDQYRNESATDRKMLKEQSDALAREKSTLQADIARAQSQLVLAQERYEMLQSNFSALRNENTELQKRSQAMSESAAKQDLRTQQVAEELVEARSLAESLRNENANGKAEKELWKRIEARLTEDNQSLMDERSRLNKLVTDLQNLQNERELADSETRRRLQSRTESLESELAEAKRKLDAEVEESRKAALRREYEEGQSRTRIDDLVKTLGNKREELAAATTARDQLQARVDEMKIDLRAAEEKVSALQPRPTLRAEPQQQTNGETQNELPAEQRLAIEVSDLKRDIELKNNELESAREQVEQYRSISQSTEEELASINETSEQYREETDRVLAEKDEKAKELEQRISDLTAELSNTQNEMSELRTQSEEATSKLEEQKAGFEAELARLRDDAERYAEEKKLYQEDLKAQAGIAQQAQASYDNELIKHAEAAKNLQEVRTQFNELKTEVAGIRAEAEAAKANLDRGEESWGEQRERFERELEEAKRRREDVDQQNKLLHSQMESFSTELQALRAGRALPAAAATGGDEEVAGSPSRGDTGNLQEVIRFLRREKEIVDVQYELSIQEAKRLLQQLDYANGQLEDTRQKLAEERRQSADRMASEGSTNKLAQTISELNLFRESATTLRNEARQAREKLEERGREVERLIAEAEPLRLRVGELEGELEGKEGELKLLQSDRDHWRERTQNIISKYDRVDPAELESLKSQLEELKAEKERLEAEQAPLREQVQTLTREAEGEGVRTAEAVTDATKKKDETLAKYREQAKEQNRKQNEQKKELAAERDAAKAELQTVQEELQAVRGELEELKVKAGTKDGAEEGEVQEDGADGEKGEEHAALHARIAEAEQHASEHSARAEELSARVQELEGQVAELQQQVKNGDESAAAPAATDGEELERRRQEVAAKQSEIETLRANATTAADESMSPAAAAAAAATVPSDDADKTHSAAMVKAEVDKALAEQQAQHELALKQKNEQYVEKEKRLKESLQKKFTEIRPQQKEAVRQEVLAEHQAEIQKLQEQHEAEVTQLKQAHAQELEKLQTSGAAAVQKADGTDGTAPAQTKVEEGQDMKALELSDAQVNDLMKNNPRVQLVLKNNIQKRVTSETEKLNKSVAEKDEEISKLQAEIAGLKEAAASAPDAAPAAAVDGTGSEGLKTRIEELEKQLEAAKRDKENAVRQAVDTAEKKAKLQVNARDMANAKVNVVKKAAEETPDKPVKEVWEVASKARAQPPATTTTKPAVPASPAAAQKPGNAVPPSPATAQGQPPQSPSTQTPEQIEAAKLKQREERFGAVQQPAASNQAPKTGTFGQASVPSAGGTFGQPSQAGSLAQAPRRPSGQPQQTAGTPPNPQAPAFTPGTANAGTGPAALRAIAGSSIPQPGRGGSGLPRAGGAAGRGGAQGISIQGAAAQSQQGGAAQRGGMQSNIGRGGSQIGRGGRGGQQSGVPRGGAQGAGQKRSYDGNGEAGDGKRTRGGGQGGA